MLPSPCPMGSLKRREKEVSARGAFRLHPTPLGPHGSSQWGMGRGPVARTLPEVVKAMSVVGAGRLL